MARLLISTSIDFFAMRLVSFFTTGEKVAENNKFCRFTGNKDVMVSISFDPYPTYDPPHQERKITFKLLFSAN